MKTAAHRGMTMEQDSLLEARGSNVGVCVWQPIETAPRDNARPLYLARFDAAGALQELDFDGGWEYWQESWELAHINGWAWTSAKGIEEPTHWAYQDVGPPPRSINCTPRLQPDGDLSDG